MTNFIQAIAIDPFAIRDIAPLLLDPKNELKVVPASILENTTREERCLFGVRHAVYGFLTEELIAFLQDIIGTKTAIEIGSGYGGLAKALNIPATDNRMQEDREIKAFYAALGQPVITYGRHVEKLNALEALNKYKPKVVIASWVTHRYNPDRSEAGGNQFGVTEEDIISACDAYVFIGNESVHAKKSIWALPHEKITPPWLYSRAGNGSADFIAIWRK